MCRILSHPNPHKPSFDDLEERNKRIRKLHYEQGVSKKALAERFGLGYQKILEILKH